MALKYIDLTNDVSGTCTVELERSSERKYVAWFDLADDENYVRSHCGLTLGTRHPTDLQQVLHTLRPSCLGRATWEGDNSDCRLWEIQASYGTWNPAERGDPAQAANPLAMPPRYRMEWERVPEPVWRDINGKPVLNTAGDPFDPPVERAGLVATLTVRRNEESPDFAALIALAENVNTAPWNGFAEKTVRFAPPAFPELEYAQESRTFYYPMVYVFEINPRNWRAKPLNAGYRQSFLSLDNPRTVVIMDSAGQPLQTPGLLDTDGRYMKPPVADNKVLYRVFDIYQDSDFSVFNLDDLFTKPQAL